MYGQTGFDLLSSDNKKVISEYITENLNSIELELKGKTN